MLREMRKKKTRRGNKDIRIISTTATANSSGLGGAVGRMHGTIITFCLLAIDAALFDEDQMSANGTFFKAEVPMTHLIV
jgi:hypothetical protein